MKRRNFLKILPAAGITPFVINGFSMRPFANSRIARILSDCGDVEERTLVLVQLKGGNDGVNTIIPIPQYDVYANLRPSIRIKENATIALDNTLPAADQIGLHPAMTAFKAMYDEGWATLIQGVGYESMNQSHFKGTDIWLSGGDSTQGNSSIASGWMGRSLQAIFPEVKGAPTTDMPDPLGIQVGDTNPSLGFHTQTEHQNAINLSGQDPAGFYSLIQTIGGAPILDLPDTEHADELAYIMSVEQSVSSYAQRITQVFNAGSNAGSYPNNTFANQLRTIARLISGGCKTKIYLCSIGGFDTHSAQAAISDSGTGTHANLLQTLTEGIKAFFDDLKGLGIADKVLACTFSEFGRRASENGSAGTDHGTLAPMFVFGKNTEPGVLGTNVNLSNLTQQGNLQGVQYDYRQVFATLLQDWIGANDEVLEAAMFDGYAKVPVVSPTHIVPPDCYLNNNSVSVAGPYAPPPRRLTLYPNPASVIAEVTYQSDAHFEAMLSLHSLGGGLVSGIRVRVTPGDNLYHLDVLSLRPGNYFVRFEDLRTGRGDVTKLVVTGR
mgnify:CR=1 FL=1